MNLLLLPATTYLPGRGTRGGRWDGLVEVEIVVLVVVGGVVVVVDVHVLVAGEVGVVVVGVLAEDVHGGDGEGRGMVGVWEEARCVVQAGGDETESALTTRALMCAVVIGPVRRGVTAHEHGSRFLAPAIRSAAPT